MAVVFSTLPLVFFPYPLLLPPPSLPPLPPPPPSTTTTTTARVYSCEGKEESRKIGLLMEWLWHYLLGEPPVGEEGLESLLPLLPHADRLSLPTRSPCFT